MASIRREVSIEVSAAQLWDALRDVGALHTRLVAGFVTDCRLEGDARIVTFANGMLAWAASERGWLLRFPYSSGSDRLLLRERWVEAVIPALLIIIMGAGLARTAARRSTAQPADEQPAQSGTVSRGRRSSQHRCVVRRFQRQAGRQAVSRAGSARKDLVTDWRLRQL